MTEEPAFNVGQQVEAPFLVDRWTVLKSPPKAAEWTRVLIGQGAVRILVLAKDLTIVEKSMYDRRS